MTHQEALIANRVQRECLLSCDGDIDAALDAADAILSMKPFDYERWGTDPTDNQAEWIDVPDKFLSLMPPESQIFLSTPAPVRQPDIIVHNHVAAPEITINVPKMEPIFSIKMPEIPTQAPPVVNVAAPEIIVKVPEQKPSTVNVAAPNVTIAPPIVNVAPPNVIVQQLPVPDKRITIRKDSAGQWQGEVKG